MEINQLVEQKTTMEIKGATLLCDEDCDLFYKYTGPWSGYPWFLRSAMGQYPHFSANYNDFDIHEDFNFIGTIRLALVIETNLEPGTCFTVNNIVFTVLSDQLALSDGTIGWFDCSQEDFDDEFDYESSKLKEFVDELFDELILGKQQNAESDETIRSQRIFSNLEFYYDF